MLKEYTVYVLDDCESTTYILKKWLEEKFNIETFLKPNDFLSRFSQVKPHICIVDVQLNANRNGLDVLKEINVEVRNENIPFIFISQDAQDFRRSNAYQLGAVDYLKKPLDKFELQHKVENLINLIYPHQTELEKIVKLDEGNLSFMLNRNNEQVAIKLTPKEFIILKHLLKNKNSIVTREQILSSLETSLNEKFVVDRVVDVHVCNIKKKLGEFKDLINTVYGVGYRIDMTKIL